MTFNFLNAWECMEAEEKRNVFRELGSELILDLWVSIEYEVELALRCSASKLSVGSYFVVFLFPVSFARMI